MKWVIESQFVAMVTDGSSAVIWLHTGSVRAIELRLCVASQARFSWSHFQQWMGVRGCWGSQGVNIMLPHHMTKPLYFTGSTALLPYIEQSITFV